MLLLIGLALFLHPRCFCLAYSYTAKVTMSIIMYLHVQINITYVCVLLEYCEQKYPITSVEKLQRDLTSKCGEERRKLTINLT